MKALRGNQLLLQAAIVADRWGMDVVAVLAEPDPVRWAIRVAAHMDLAAAERLSVETAREQARR